MTRSIDTSRIVVFMTAIACGGCGGSTQTQAHGSAMYAKPSSQGGQPVPPQQNQGDLSLAIAIDGTGTFAPVQGAACALTSGSLSESITATGQVRSDDTYASAFSTESATASGPNELCGTLKAVKLNSITSMTVQATIPASSTNCQGYCNATASAQCQGSADPNCSATASASCTTQCRASTRIAGHGSLQSSDMTTTNSQLASSSGDTDAKVDLVFDSLQ